jgi:hypothetical protein
MTITSNIDVPEAELDGWFEARGWEATDMESAV